MSKSISCCPLTSKSTDIINYNCFRLWQNFSFFSCTLLGQCLFLFWFRQDDVFHWIKQYNRLVFYLEVMVWSSKYLIDNFVYYKHFFFFFSHKTFIDGLESWGLLVDYCDVFISCLDSRSDGTHSLYMDPLASKWRNAKFLKMCSHKGTNSSTSCIVWG